MFSAGIQPETIHTGSCPTSRSLMLEDGFRCGPRKVSVKTPPLVNKSESQFEMQHLLVLYSPRAPGMAFRFATQVYVTFSVCCSTRRAAGLLSERGDDRCLPQSQRAEDAQQFPGVQFSHG